MSDRPLPNITLEDPSLAVLQKPPASVRHTRALMLRLGKWQASALITLMAMVLAVSFTALARWSIGATENDFWRGLCIAAGVAALVSPMCSALWMSLLEYQMRLEHSYRTLAMGDMLTGLPNRRWILQKGERAGALDSQALSVLLIDIDRFRAVNDTHGQQVGDAVLRHVAQVLTGQLRQGDFIGRFGGEEFLVLTSDESKQSLAELGERMRTAVAGSPLTLDGQAYSATVSIGGAVMRVDETSDRFGMAIREADVALYAAKRQGRNRVRMANRHEAPFVPIWSRRASTPAHRYGRSNGRD